MSAIIDEDARKVAAILNPLAFPFLELYVDSRLGTSGYAQGALVDPWPDQSVNGRNLTNNGFDIAPAMQRTINLSPNGVELVRFNGTNTALATGTINPFPTAVRGHTYYAYGDWRNTTAPPAPFAGSIVWQTDVFTSSPKELLFHQVAGTNNGFRDATGTRLTNVRQNGFHQIAYVFNAPNGVGAGEVYIDGVLAGSFTPWSVGGSAAAVGTLGNANSNVPMNVDLGHFLWYSDTHTPATIGLFAAWAALVWG